MTIFLKEAAGAPTHRLPDGDLERSITPLSATTSATKTLATLPVSQSEAGRGELNNAATWDDFPNGRFGDFKSPAFGEQDLWGGSHFSVRCILQLNLLFSDVLLEGRSSITMGYSKIFEGPYQIFSGLSSFQGSYYPFFHLPALPRVSCHLVAPGKTDGKRLVDCRLSTSCEWRQLL